MINGPDLSFESQAPNLTNVDTYGHGTHMAGIIAGDGTMSGGQWGGVAPRANLVSVKVAGADEQTIAGKHVIVATGSNPRALPGAPFDEDNILSNDGALRIPGVPKRLGLIGSGVVGLEMGSVWRRLGAEVTVLEALPVFMGAVDEQLAREGRLKFLKDPAEVTVTKRAERAYDQRVKRDPRDLLELALPWIRARS